MSLLDANQEAAERQKFESFSMPKTATPLSMSRPNMPAAQGAKRHSRSHSRNLSLSLAPAALNSSLANNCSPTTTPSPTSTPTTPAVKRNSHHRRLSSVSTRHESAEIMGVPVPELPASDPSEKDSVRLRALLALEGKPDSFKEVEIPQLHDKTDNNNRSWEFPTKPSFPPGPGLGSSKASKRDSFKLLASGPSNKDTLGTLLEEEEEEESLENDDVTPSSAPPTVVSMEQKQPRPALRPLSLTPDVLQGENKPSPCAKSAPPLKLRALSLAAVHTFGGSSPSTPQSFRSSSTTTTTEESDSVQSHGSFQSFRSSESFRSFRVSQSFRSNDGSSNPVDPSQSFRSSPQSLRPLSLPNRAASETFQAQGEDFETCQEMEPVGSIHSTHSATHPNKPKRPELTLDLSCQSQRQPNRRSSISYKISSQDTQPSWGPTESRLSSISSSSSSRSSMSSSANWFNNPISADPDTVNTPASSVATFSSSLRSRTSSNVSLSASEQHFLFKSHNALLARIQDLERTLSIKRRESLGMGFESQSGTSRPTSYSSDASMEGVDPESYSLFAQVRAERDELKKDVDGWRARVAGLEQQVGILGSRVDQERREAWVARSRIGLLDAEKASMEKLLLESRARADDLEKKVEGLVDELDRAGAQRNVVEEENARLRLRIQELEEEKEKVSLTGVSIPQVFTASLSRRDPSFASEDDSSTDIETPYGDEDESSLSFGAPQTPTLDFDSQLDVVVEEEEESMYHFNKNQKVPRYDVHEFDEDDEEEAEEASLTGYEEEAEDDQDLFADMMGSTSASSLGSVDRHLTAYNATELPESPISPATPQAPSVGNLSQTWTFPPLAAPTPVLPPSFHEERRDKFFECFDSSSSDTSGGDHSPLLDYSYEQSKSAFRRGLQETGDDTFAFDLPKGVDVVEKLGTVMEEDEEEEEDVHSEVMDTASIFDEDDVFGEVGGITITFTPAEVDDDVPSASSIEVQEMPTEVSPTSTSSGSAPSPKEPPSWVTRKPVPVYQEEEEESASASVQVPQTPPKPRSTSVSRLPRAIKSPTSPPSPGRVNASPPSVIRSFIPQRVGSPTRSPSKGNPSSPTFIRQPTTRKVAADRAADNGSPLQPHLRFTRRMSGPALR